MKNRLLSISIPLILLGLVVAWFALTVYTVDETEQVVITRLGRPIGDPVTDPGLHFLTRPRPLEEVRRFEKRIQQWDGEANRIPTKDKRYIWVDTTARWKIVDALKFLQSFPIPGNEQARLKDILDSKVREVISKYKVIEIVRSSNRIFDVLAANPPLVAAKPGNAQVDEVKTAADKRTGNSQGGYKIERLGKDRGRDFVRQEIFDRAKPEIADYGIELIDIRVKRINYDRDVRMEVYNRMRSERQRASSLYRSEGKGKRAGVEGLTVKELERIRSEAVRQAEGIKGKADAEATRVYAEAYSKDPEFYSFLLTLESYKSTFNNNSKLILSTDNEYLKYLQGISEPANEDK